jgi:hypothetical protein
MSEGELKKRLFALGENPENLTAEQIDALLEAAKKEYPHAEDLQGLERWRRIYYLDAWFKKWFVGDEK